MFECPNVTIKIINEEFLLTDECFKNDWNACMHIHGLILSSLQFYPLPLEYDENLKKFDNEIFDEFIQKIKDNADIN